MRQLNEMQIYVVPKVVEEYSGRMSLSFQIGDSTCSYVSDLLISKDGHKYLLIAIIKDNVGSIEFVLPGGHIITRKGNSNDIDIINLKKLIERQKKFFFKSAKERGITYEA